MGQAVESADVVVIGGGPGGYVAAIRAAQLGKRVILVEKDPLLGGVCLRKGCIPSKALIHASEFYYHLDHSDNMGITVDKIHLDPKKMQEWKHSIITRLSDGVKALCQKNGVEVIRAKAYFQSSHLVGLEPIDKDAHLEYGALEFRHCVIATGTVQRSLPEFPRDGTFVLSSTEILELDQIPKSLVIVGGGYIGVEMAIVYAKFGTKVTIVTTADRLIPAVDTEIGDVLTKHCEELGISVIYGATVTAADRSKNPVPLTITTKKDGSTQTVLADKMLIAIGRVPDTSHLQLENTKIQLDERGFIKVDEQRRTTDSHIFAIGDIAGGALLAHKASMEGKVAAEVICGLPSAFDMQVIPAVIYSDPEVAMVGMTEEEATKKGYIVKVGKFPFKASGRALTMNQPIGFVKVVADEKTHLILGVHIIGPDASDLISEAALAIEMGSKVEDVGATIHPHPSLSEALSEAMHSVLGESVHVFSGKKK